METQRDIHEKISEFCLLDTNQAQSLELAFSIAKEFEPNSEMYEIWQKLSDQDTYIDTLKEADFETFEELLGISVCLKVYYMYLHQYIFPPNGYLSIPPHYVMIKRSLISKLRKAGIGKTDFMRFCELNEKAELVKQQVNR